MFGKQAIQSALDDYSWEKVAPGGVVAWGSAAEYETVCFGHHTPGGKKIAKSDLFDLASVTKPIAGAALAAKLISEGALSLDTLASDVWPEVKHWTGVTVKHLLGHGSGLPAHIKFYEKEFSVLAEEVAKVSLDCPVGEKSVYSDLGYIALGEILARVKGQPLRTQVEAMSNELGMRHCQFVDNGAGERIEAVPTEDYPHRGWASGVVHDDNAFAGGGIFGHAGLFAPVEDVANFAQSMLKIYDGDTIAGITSATLRDFFSQQAAPGTWRLGWDTPSPPPTETNVGTVWQTDGVVGHLGFTGTSVWLNLKQQQFVVILTNRVQFSWDKAPIRGLRRHLMDAAARSLA